MAYCHLLSKLLQCHSLEFQKSTLLLQNVTVPSTIRKLSIHHMQANEKLRTGLQDGPKTHHSSCRDDVCLVIINRL